MGCGGSKSVNADGDKVNVIFVIGGPGSGKGTQCKMIKDKYGYEHLSTGDILRKIVSEEKVEGWQALKEKMDAGEFVDSAELVSFVKAQFEQMRGKKVLLDGFPRNQSNLDEWYKQTDGLVDLKATLYFACSEEEMKNRLLNRNEGRDDDKEDVIVGRIEKFQNETVPLIEQFRGGCLVEIDANQTKDEVFEEVQKRFEDNKLD
jgi:adenylate kinase family enzyme